MLGDPIDAQLQQQSHRRIEAGEVLVRQGHELEATGVGSQGGIVAGEAGQIVGVLEGQPSSDGRVKRSDQLAPDVDESGSPGREEPLLPAAGQDVHLDPTDVERDLSDPLDRIDHQPGASLAGGRGEATEIDSVAAAELYLGHGHTAHPRIAEPLEDPVLIRPPRRGSGDQLHAHAPVLQPHPRVHVGGELTVAHQDDIARLKRERAGSQPQAEPRIDRQADLLGLSPIKRGRGPAGLDQDSEHLSIGQEVRHRSPSIELVQHLSSPLRQRTDAGVIQVDGGGRPGELGGAQRGDVVGRGVGTGQMRRGLGPRTHRALLLGSRASRMPSPTRLNPSTASPMARPGAKDTQGATCSRSRPSATMAPQLGVGGWAPRPTKESAASAMMAPAIPSVAAMITWLRTLGRRCRRSTRWSWAPRAFAARTYSEPLRTRTWDRTRRAMPAQPTAPITTNTIRSDGETAAATAMSRSSVGNARVTSASRMTSASIQRP